MTWPVSEKRLAKGIYWERSWNLVEGCTPISPACRNCWAAAEAVRRAGNPNPKIRASGQRITTAAGNFNGIVRLREDRLKKPTPKQRPAVWSLWTDIMHPDVPFAFAEEARFQAARCRQHIFLFCTKRPERLPEWLGDLRPDPNIILMTTAENQDELDKRLPHLLKCEGWKLGLSAEPLLGPLDLGAFVGGWSCFSCGYRGPDTDQKGNCPSCGCLDGDGFGMAENDPSTSSLDWVTCGGESGTDARPSHLKWFRSLRDECAVAGVPFHFKSWGEYYTAKTFKDASFVGGEAFDHPAGGTSSANYCKRWPDGHAYFCAGKRRAGRLLDGKLHDAFPEMEPAK